jgi:hypothetical protein
MADVGFGPRAKYLLSAVALLALAIVVAVSGGRSAPGATARPLSKSGELRVVAGHKLKTAGVYAGGRRIRTRGFHTAAVGPPTLTPAPVRTPALGYESPVAVPSPDGTAIAYNTWRWTRPLDLTRAPSTQNLQRGDPIAAPEVFVRDLATGKDVSLGAGTMSVAYRSDGAIAYARGTDAYRLDMPFTSDILVRQTAGSNPVSWTPNARGYSVVGWGAAERLVAHRAIAGVEAHDVVVLDAPGQIRTVAQAAEVVAVSPSGKTMVVSEGDPLAGTTTALKLIDIATGTALSQVFLPDLTDPVTGAQIAFADDPGDWDGDELVVRTDSGLLVLRATDSKISTLQVLRLELNGIPLNEPRFANQSRTVIEAWANLPESQHASVRYQCNRVTLACSRGTPVVAESFGRPAYERSAIGRSAK